MDVTRVKSGMSVKKLTLMGLLCAVALGVTATLRLPVAFLTYEPKDVLITIGGFMLGPLAAAAISIVVAFLEMITVSDSGPIGMLMNALAGCSFACTASFIYTRKHNMKGAVIGLSVGVIVMTAIMILWNYLITPLYLNIERADVVKILIPLLLPFNILKAAVNMALVMLLYKPLVSAVRKSGLLPQSKSGKSSKRDPFFMLAAVVLLCTCLLLILVLAGII